jgi:hypothetical protein
MNDLIKKLREELARDFTVTSLRLAITVWALLIIALAWLIDNAWILAGILAYEVLP